MSIKEVNADKVLSLIIEGEDVYMFRKHSNSSIKFTRLRDYTVGSINGFLELDNVLFFIIK